MTPRGHGDGPGTPDPQRPPLVHDSPGVRPILAAITWSKSVPSRELSSAVQPGPPGHPLNAGIFRLTRQLAALLGSARFLSRRKART
jgi:hypothetical protein